MKIGTTKEGDEIHLGFKLTPEICILFISILTSIFIVDFKSKKEGYKNGYTDGYQARIDYEHGK